MKKLLLVLLCLIIFTGCSNNVYDQYHCWSDDHILEFEQQNGENKAICKAKIELVQDFDCEVSKFDEIYSHGGYSYLNTYDIISDSDRCILNFEYYAKKINDKFYYCENGDYLDTDKNICEFSEERDDLVEYFCPTSRIYDWSLNGRICEYFIGELTDDEHRELSSKLQNMYGYTCHSGLSGYCVNSKLHYDIRNATINGEDSYEYTGYYKIKIGASFKCPDNYEKRGYFDGFSVYGVDYWSTPGCIREENYEPNES